MDVWVSMSGCVSDSNYLLKENTPNHTERKAGQPSKKNSSLGGGTFI